MSREGGTGDPSAPGGGGREQGAWGFEAVVRHVAEARTSVTWVPPPAIGDDDAPDVAAITERLALLTRRGLRVRVLCPDAVTSDRRYVALLAAHPGSLAPRVSGHGWPEHVLVDDRVALLRTRAGDGDDDTATTVRAHAVVSMLAAVLEAAWHSAVPLPPPLPDESRLATEPARRILDLLGAGYRDAAAAAELGLSIRTYRRHVAELMGELRAVSRFQAGVHATQLGLLPRDEAQEPLSNTG